MQMPIKSKILDLKKLKKIRTKFLRKKIILCHGVFDLLHVGHINYFKSAKKYGNILVVSVTADKFVNKGPGRPVFSINDRLKFLQEIECIDYVYVSNDSTAEKVIKNLKPNFYCKGNDYSKNQIKDDKNLKKEINALKVVKGKFKIIKEISFSSSQFINENSLQNFSQECKNYINSIRKKFNLNQIMQNFNTIKKKKVLIIGETMIDRYITTEAIGKSGKDAMIVLKPKKEIKFLGGAAYIANLCSTFVKDIKIMSFLGKENAGKKFVLENLNKNIKHNFLLKKNSPTITKLRYLDVFKKTKIIGVYDLNDDLISKAEEKNFYNLLKKNIDKFDIIIVADYGHGIITEKIRKLILTRNNKVFLNTQINSFNRGYHTVFKYKKINTLVINVSELRYELRDKHSKIPELAKILSKKISVKNIIVTRGKEGSVLVSRKNNLALSCPAFDQNIVDTVGAGDTFFAICSLAMGSKIDSKISMMMGAISAGFSVDQIGNKLYYNFQTCKKHLTHIFK
jgi:rfaE bifunctional protein kinase chain/domain/rfaE bifunctional protein nucleotidyltransferase chain/domain